MPNDLSQSPGRDLSVTLGPLLSDVAGDTVKAALDRIAGLRIRHVQLAATMPGLRPRELDRTARRDLLATLRRRELLVSGLDAWIPSAHFNDPAHADRAVQALIEIIDLADDLGRVPVSVSLPREEAKDRPIARALLARAEHVGVMLADHAVPDNAASAESTQLLDGMSIGVDPAAWLSLGRDPIAAVHAGAARLVCARVVDLLRNGMRGPIGTRDGRLDVTNYKIALSVSGCRQPAVIDARQWSDPWGGAAQCVQAWGDATTG